jgi:hypothetical protein
MAISCTKISFSTGFFSINTSSKRSFSFTRSMHGNRIKVWVPQVTWVMWYLVFVRLETVLAYGQKSFWTLPMLLLGDKAQVEACFGPFRDSAHLDAR